MNNLDENTVMDVTEKLTLASTNMAKVYSSGKKKGIEEGRKAAWDAFWDIFQESGARREYGYAFVRGWNADNFKPKYDIIIEGDARGAFQYWRQEPIANIAEICREQGITLDFSGATNTNTAFRACYSPDLPTLDLRKVTSMEDMFAFSKIKRIEKIISSEATRWDTLHVFTYNSTIEHILFEGVIGKSIDAHTEPFDKETIVSLINTLSTTVSGKTCSLKKASVDKAFETSEGANDGSGSPEWNALAATRTNWTISLS